MSGSDCSDLEHCECVDSLYERIEALEHKLAVRDAFIAGMTYPKVVVTDAEGNVRLQTDDLGNASVGTVQETDRLRAKKKQIYEDLQDAVKREWIGLTDEERYLGDVRSEEEIEYARAIEAKLREKNMGVQEGE